MQKLIYALLFLALFSCTNQKQEFQISPELEVIEDAYHFYIIGDWGRQGEDGQQEVADMMAKAAKVIEPEFIISTGDNFYPNGVASINDPLWKTSFEEVYHHFSLQLPWYVVLGNHDYRGNAQAEIDYMQVSRRWNMPARYYNFDKTADDSTQMAFVFIDTSPFEHEYYQEEKYKSKVITQDTAQQKQWLDSVLNIKQEVDWVFVSGHHPMYTGGKRIDDPNSVRANLEKLFTKYEVNAYFAGHEHDLQHIKPQAPTHHFISGAGSEIRPTGKIDETLYAESEHGFMIASVTQNEVLVQVINEKGELRYTYTLSKTNK
ncbi:tartrate-resistant acid phosphatase type 5 family protein [Cytophagales bacterium LB-30]|uniref:acid phosphatase n=1 Tax=Shiella aurantiaca TaxID=3058365 RepID=A0ABT8F5X0_9BACT|nr:tartrate-resistant acid phosphatase type 5 family protein [Shiella aurantiaca]MDN4165785.1 tartrate-resistant acid phosphatase type 5 family protein [Shiella aurantiaca]